MEYCSMFQRNQQVWWDHLHVYDQKKADYGREHGALAYEWIARYTLAFLNTYLMNDSGGRTFLTNSPTDNAHRGTS
jgi:hypothetical protein